MGDTGGNPPSIMGLDYNLKNQAGRLPRIDVGAAPVAPLHA
ncbi:hypothetical protein XaFJ1_GM000278 [Xanthomonas albilineans]|nr:hypothetical protein XaFJ1_GM000278 [Xanthomonas albilineans]